jgi:hypothetical protein
LLACGLLLVREHRWPETLGGVAGVGLICLVIAFLNRGSSPCPSSGMSVSAEDAASLPAGSSIECGGLAPGPWLLAGGVLVAIGIGGYALLRPARRAGRSLAG